MQTNGSTTSQFPASVALTWQAQVEACRAADRVSDIGAGHSYRTELRLRTQAEDARRHADWLAASAETQARVKAKREAA